MKNDFVKLGGILFIITFVVALALGVANSVTKPKIEALEVKTKSDAVQKVITGKIAENSAVKIELKNSTSVKEIMQYDLEDGTKAYSAVCAPSGYAGEISMMVGFNEKLEVTGISILNMTETPGLGMKAKDEGFIKQFIGKTGTIKVSKKGKAEDSIEAISGATITSAAVTKGVNDAVSELKEVAK